jgi:glycosyltransferase involved in cell wall biosynthesis
VKKVLIITYYWPPSGGGGVQRWVKFAKYLPYFDIVPIVLTVDPDYASYPLLDISLNKDVDDKLEIIKTKSFEPLNLYSKISPSKEIPYGGFANEANPGIFQKVSRFVRGNFFIPDARIGWNRFAHKKALELIKKYNIDTVITSSPPHSTQLIGLRLKRELNINWIADLRDPWTDIYFYNKMFHTSLAKSIDKRKESEVLNESDSIIVVSESIKRLFATKLDSDSIQKITVISNGFDSGDFKNIKEERNEKFTIAYTGTIADNYNAIAFFKALKGIINSTPNAKIQVNFVGRVSNGYLQIINNSSLKNICTTISHVKHEESVAYLQNADALFLAIPDVPQNEGILTGKLFEYLAAKKPIIGIGPVNGDAASIINECGAGSMFSYNDESGIENNIKEMYIKWDEYSSIKLENLKHTRYSRENLTRALASLIMK